MAGSNEFLYPGTSDITHVDCAFRINGYRMRHFKLPVVVAESAHASSGMPSRCASTHAERSGGPFGWSPPSAKYAVSRPSIAIA